MNQNKISIARALKQKSRIAGKERCRNGEEAIRRQSPKGALRPALFKGFQIPLKKAFRLIFFSIIFRGSLNMSNRKLTKAEIVENVNGKLDIERNSIKPIINEFFEEVKDGLRKSQTIELRGFGTFEVRIRKGREKARNPKTGDVVAVDRHGVAIFRPGKELKDFVWDITTGPEEE